MRPISLHTILIALTLFGSSAMAADVPSTATKTALFAGGCFWCMQPSYDNTPGVVATSVGYTGGDAASANYDAVSAGKTAHVEAIEITYDPAKVTYETLLATYWENIDPTDAGGQFADRGDHYRTAIFFADAAQKTAAELSKKAIQTKFAPAPIAVQILPAKPFYPAEDYHQKYYQKNSTHYNAYKQGSGRAGYLKQTWGK